MKNIEDYYDIIDLPHPEPKNHPRMDGIKRAAQFAPFAALTGHDAAVEKAAKMNEEDIENEVETVFYDPA